jgi:photosynthetic reaction center cytochrome c subunit
MTNALTPRRGRLPALVAALTAGVLLLAACERPPVETVQRGYRGTGMNQVYNPRTVAEQATLNAVPPAPPQAPTDGPAASTVFKNVKVLGDLSVGEFTRLMVTMTEWVSPAQGCAYCHQAGEDFSTDTLYTKVVSRRMLQMTQQINADWKTHVAETGVTCYTCHRGQPVPANITYAPAAQQQQTGMVGNDAGQNKPGVAVGLTSLPYDPLTPFLSNPADIRVIGDTALPTGNRASTKQTEFTYALMMHMSQSLGVNCTYCHNTRSFAEWDASTPQRGISWYGIRMTRDINAQYLEPLTGILPDNRLGPTGDVPKVNCATCHQGAYKPLYGAPMLKDHPELRAVRAALVPSAAAAPGAGELAPPPIPAGATTADAVLLFAVGSSTLAADAGKTLETLIASLKADPSASVTISGYHSATGDLARNQELSKQRAFAVRDAFKAAGIAEDRIVLEKPQSAEANLSGEDANARRVEVTLR